MVSDLEFCLINCMVSDLELCLINCIMMVSDLEFCLIRGLIPFNKWNSVRFGSLIPRRGFRRLTGAKAEAGLAYID